MMGGGTALNMYSVCKNKSIKKRCFLLLYFEIIFQVSRYQTEQYVFTSVLYEITASILNKEM